MAINKRGGDAFQANAGHQEAGNYADVTPASASGNGFLHGVSGDSDAYSDANQDVHQRMDHVNDAMAGDGGYDNTDANTDSKPKWIKT